MTDINPCSFCGMETKVEVEGEYHKVCCPRCGVISVAVVQPMETKDDEDPYDLYRKSVPMTPVVRTSACSLCVDAITRIAGLESEVRRLKAINKELADWWDATNPWRDDDIEGGE